MEIGVYTFADVGIGTGDVGPAQRTAELIEELAFAAQAVTPVMSVRPASLVSARASDRVGPRWLPWSETETRSSRVRCGSDGDHPVDRPHRQARADRDQR